MQVRPIFQKKDLNPSTQKKKYTLSQIKQEKPQIEVIELQIQKSQKQSTIKILDLQILQIERKNIPLFLFFISNVAYLFYVFQQIPMFFTDNCDPKTYFSIGSLVVITFFFIALSLYFVNVKQLLLYYFLLDTILVSWIASMIGFKGMLDVVQSREPFFTTALKYLGPISSFCANGTFRILIKHANFKKWQNILFKISMMANGMCYFMIGVYVMYTDHMLTKGLIPQMDTLSKDFCLLFVFGGLSLFKELLNLNNRFDNTDKLNYDYKIKDQIVDNENEESEEESFKQQINKKGES